MTRRNHDGRSLRMMNHYLFVFTIASLFLLPFSVEASNDHNEKIRFEEIAAKAQVRHVHKTRQFPGKKADVLEMFTSGGSSVAVGDYNNDGYDDLFVTSSDTGAENKLYKNNGDMTFADVSKQAGVTGGNDPLSIVADALWFDYDNDGWRDLLVARFGTPLLYHNEGNGKFKDVTARSGMNRFGNTIAAIAFDYDKDGNLDVLFGNYFPPENLIELKDPHVLPNNLDNAVNGGGASLWRGKGDGTFLDVTKKAGLDNQMGWILDAGHADFNNDGHQDIYLAGDYGTDRLYFNNGDGTFRDVTEIAMGFDTKKGMNAETGDFNNDGWMDVYVTNITDEYMKECNMLWQNNGGETFTDVSKETGTCNTLWGWAAKFGDYDNDGWLDIFAVNGLRSASEENYIPVLVNMITAPGMDFTDVNNWPDIGAMSWSGYQKKKMFRNLGGQAFKEISAAAGVDNNLDGRGLGQADFDNDGLLDFYQVNADQPSLFYRNTTEGAGSWIELQLIGGKSNKDAIGARVTVSAGGKTWISEVNGGNGYAGQSTQRLHFGLGSLGSLGSDNKRGSDDKLGSLGSLGSVEIRWPSGQVDQVTVPVNQITTIEEAKGIVQK